MNAPLEDYALIGNTRTAALVCRDGGIDWLCLPRLDSPACFAAILGDEENGSWRIEPKAGANRVRRRYLPETLVLETAFETGTGCVAVTDFMPRESADDRVDLVRIVRGVAGRVVMRTCIRFRFDYGRVIPWVTKLEDGIRAIAGPDAVVLRTPVPTMGHDFRTEADFEVNAGEEVPFVLTWYRSHGSEPPPIDPRHRLHETTLWWRRWAERCVYQGPWRDAVVRSLITLKALVYEPTGGMVAAPTTSLPEIIGGVRNWDYRHCWLRDATFTLYAFLSAGYTAEAVAWRDWLLRAIAGCPQNAQIMYGLAGERRLDEQILPWLRGYGDSAPVRIGNAAHAQFQLDVFGEVMDAFHVARREKIEPIEDGWRVQKALMEFLEGAWQYPDEGIWEVRGPRRHFTHSKVMAWVGFDRAVKAVERFGLEGPVDRWRMLRDLVHADVCDRGYNPSRKAFTQYYGGDGLDGALLMIPLVGFLPCHDPRVLTTVEAIRRELTSDGLVRRYTTDPSVDGLPPGEGAFIACTFWLVDNLAMQGRTDEARALFERLLSLRNDVGLLSEEYDTGTQRLLGNFPQAFSHLSLINTARNLTVLSGPAAERSHG